MNRKALLRGTFIGSAVLSVNIAMASNISYEELKLSAYEHSERLRMRSIDTQIEKARLGEVYSTLYPQLSLNYSGEYNHNLDPAASGYLSAGGISINSATPYKHSASVGLNYELYHFGTTMKQIEMQKSQISAKKYEGCGEESKLYRDILDRYSDALKATNEIDIKRRMIEERKVLYAMRERLYAAGKESRISIGDEAIRIIDLQRDVERASLRMHEDILNLSSLSHIELNDNDRLLPLDDSTSAKTLDFDATPKGYEYFQKLRQKDEEIAMNFRSQMPTVSLYSYYYLYGSDTQNFSNAWDNMRANSWNAGMSLRWSLFEGFKYNNTAERLRLERNRIKSEYEEIKREYEYESRTHRENIDRLIELNRSGNKALDESNRKMVMTKRLRAQGEVDALSEINLRLETMERELALNNDSIQRSYEMEALRIQQRGTDGCLIK